MTDKSRSGSQQGVCPQCGEAAAMSAQNPWRPFCSKRCKLVDLEGWFAERHVIPGPDDELPPGSDTGSMH